MAKPNADLRRAVRAGPTCGNHGPNRGGENACSWTPVGDRCPTRVPFDVADFLREEFLQSHGPRIAAAHSRPHLLGYS